jgi:hypothetical protein
MHPVRLCIAYFVCPEDHVWSTGDADTPGDWAFTEPYYVSLLKICDAWSQAFTGARSAASLTVQLEGFDEESEDDAMDRLVASIEAAGGTYRTVAAVWYMFCVTGKAFRSEDVSFKSSTSHRHLFWWLCEQLLELSSMSENEAGFSVVLPRSDAAKAERDWHATEKEVCKAEMKLAVPNDEARAAKVLLYEGIFYQVVAEERAERPLEASEGASGGNSEVSSST